MAVTATASDTLVSHIIQDTGMVNPEIVSVSPNKENLCFRVQTISSKIETFTPLVESLKIKEPALKEQLYFILPNAITLWAVVSVVSRFDGWSFT